MGVFEITMFPYAINPALINVMFFLGVKVTITVHIQRFVDWNEV